jgi:hypothetical protein
MTNDPLRITHVAALNTPKMTKAGATLTRIDAPYALHIVFGDGLARAVDLTDWIANTKALAKLKDQSLFANARVGEHGTSVVWIDDELELGADNLRNLSEEQAGGIGHERIVEWMYRNNLTQECAAEAIGISRRMLNYYLSAEKPIPKTVWLACLGWEGNQDMRKPVRSNGTNHRAAA